MMPEGRRSDLLLRQHGGAAGAHLGTARTLALVEQGFYWPGMRADVKHVCLECDCALLKKRRGRRGPLHQCIVGAPMERLAMDVAGPYINMYGKKLYRQDGVGNNVKTKGGGVCIYLSEKLSAHCTKKN